MGFKFNFLSKDNQTRTNHAGCLESVDKKVDAELITVERIYDANWIDVDDPTTEIGADEIKLNDELMFLIRSLADVQFRIAENDPMDDGERSHEISKLQHLLKSATDIVQGVYEGGLKTWECSLDLSEYIANNLNSSLTGKNVLELGCGSGLPGICCLKPRLKAKSVTFQDYNASVLTQITAPNVLLNAEGISLSDTGYATVNFRQLAAETPVKFVAGDWRQLGQRPDLLKHNFYDVVVSSETVYNKQNCLSLLNLIKLTMKKPSGQAFVAAKTNYFGCTGSVLDFINLIKSDGDLESSVVFTSQSSIKREIIMLKWA